MSYLKECADRCEWCRKGGRPLSHAPVHKVYPMNAGEGAFRDPSITTKFSQYLPCTAPTRDQYITELLARAERAEQALTEAREDGERLDWLENAQDLNVIEPGAGFPDGKWTIWRDGDFPTPHLGRGQTLRAAIDAARGRNAEA